MTPWVIFTDLDETLLDRDTYSFEPALPALAEVKRRGIPLVMCTSKTAAETVHFAGRLGVAAPYGVENGGGIYIPRGYFPGPLDGATSRGEHDLVPLSAPRPAILAAYADLKGRTAGAIRGFSEMSVDEIARETGLPPEMAALAGQREFDEPFRFEWGEAAFAWQLSSMVRDRGLRVTKGGRFYHLHGDTDKGRAVRLLIEQFRKKLGDVRTMAIGDSELDQPLLAAADVAIAVQRRDGTHDPALAAIPGVIKVDHRGPAGWNRGVLSVL